VNSASPKPIITVIQSKDRSVVVREENHHVADHLQRRESRGLGDELSSAAE
jgi:hypothetical protein